MHRKYQSWCSGEEFSFRLLWFPVYISRFVNNWINSEDFTSFINRNFNHHILDLRELLGRAPLTVVNTQNPRLGLCKLIIMVNQMKIKTINKCWKDPFRNCWQIKLKGVAIVIYTPLLLCMLYTRTFTITYQSRIVLINHRLSTNSRILIFSRLFEIFIICDYSSIESVFRIFDHTFIYFTMCLKYKLI